MDSKKIGIFLLIGGAIAVGYYFLTKSKPKDQLDALANAIGIPLAKQPTSNNMSIEERLKLTACKDLPRGAVCNPKPIDKGTLASSSTASNSTTSGSTDSNATNSTPSVVTNSGGVTTTVTEVGGTRQTTVVDNVTGAGYTVESTIRTTPETANAVTSSTRGNTSGTGATYSTSQYSGGGRR